MYYQQNPHNGTSKLCILFTSGFIWLRMG